VGKILPLGDLPLNIAVSPDQRLASVTNNGQSDQSINFIDVKKGIVIQTIPIGKSWLGLTFSDDRRYLYASGGNDNIIIRYAVLKKHLSNPDTIRIGKP
jgi:DNA-binding beta-propeller fold protein YncE